MPLVLRPTTSADIKDFIDDTFHEHYIKMVGSRCDDRSIMLEAVPAGTADETASRLGALSGDCWWGGAMIGRLVVAPECRKGGVGSKLIKRALSDMRKMGANVAYVETFDFQAPTYYPKHGFTLDFTRGGFAADRVFYYFSRPLTDANILPDDAAVGASDAAAHTIDGAAAPGTTATVVAAAAGSADGVVVRPAEDTDEINQWFRRCFNEHGVAETGDHAHFTSWAFEVIETTDASAGVTIRPAPASSSAGPAADASVSAATGAAAPTDAAGEVVRLGAIEGHCYWGGLMIKLLIVSEAARHKGVGTLLVQRALDHGRQLGCTLACVETMSFQAPAFWPRFGFKEDVVRGGWRGGSALHYFSMPLVPTGSWPVGPDAKHGETAALATTVVPDSSATTATKGAGAAAPATA